LAAATPQAGDELPVLASADITVREAAPSPASGPERDAIIALNEASALSAEAAVTGVLQRHLDRVLGVVLARVRGPRARKGTKWWVPSGNDSTLEVKAIDTTYVAPDSLTDGLAKDVRPVILTIATDAATDTARRLGDPEDLSAYDSQEIEQAVDEAIRLILGIADRHVRELRQAVLDADTDASSLENLLDRVEKAHRKGGNWVLMSGRTLANALANDAAYGQALRLGCTHAQWVSRRDGRVRPTHVRADGQVRRMGKQFKVGKFELRHPCDPHELPLSWPEVAGCRCRLLFRRPDDNARKLFEVIDRTLRDGSAAGRSIDAVNTALAAAAALPDGASHTPAPQGYGFPPEAPLITLAEPVLGYRQLPETTAIIPGQQITTSGQLVLGLTLAAVATASTLIVLVPAGTVVATADGAVILPAGTVLDVLGTGASGVRAQVVA
jgi:hypothetical protein